MKQYPTPRMVRIKCFASPNLARMRLICASTMRPLPMCSYPQTALSKSSRDCTRPARSNRVTSNWNSITVKGKGVFFKNASWLNLFMLSMPYVRRSLGWIFCFCWRLMRMRTRSNNSLSEKGFLR